MLYYYLRHKIPHVLEYAEKGRRTTREELLQLIAEVWEHGWIDNEKCRGLLNVGAQKASYLLKKMCRRDLLKKEGQRRWTKYRLQ
jgi:hypothetical protein